MDHYSVLGVKTNATKPQIKDAFKKLAMKFHPDKHTESSKSAQNYATWKFRQVSEAYEVLANDSKRSEYDSRCGYGRSRGNRGGVASASASTSKSSFYGGSGFGNGSEDFDAFKERCRNRYRHGGSGGGGSGFGAVVRFLSSPVIFISIAFASAMVATTFIFENRRSKSGKMHTCRKSCEDAMEWPRRASLRQHHRARRSSNHARHYYYNYPPRCDE